MACREYFSHPRASHLSRAHLMTLCYELSANYQRDNTRGLSGDNAFVDPRARSLARTRLLLSAKNFRHGILNASTHARVFFHKGNAFGIIIIIILWSTRIFLKEFF